MIQSNQNTFIRPVIYVVHIVEVVTLWTVEDLTRVSEKVEEWIYPVRTEDIYSGFYRRSVKLCLFFGGVRRWLENTINSVYPNFNRTGVSRCFGPHSGSSFTSW